VSRGVEVYLSWLHRPTINGAFGIDVGLNTKALEALSRELPKTGVTSFLPTVISWPAERYADYVGAIKEATSSPGAALLDAHLEGPLLSPALVALTIQPICSR
jgi:N-acetylglucosamine-6-phosphate deacetylase